MWSGPPLRIGFPVVDCGPWTTEVRGPAILLQMEPIAPAVDLKDPIPHLKVVGQLQDGRKVEFTISLAAWREAMTRPVIFTSDMRAAIGSAPVGVLFDKNGSPLRRKHF